MNETTERSHELIEQMLDSLNTNVVFGAPQHAGDVTLIPVSRVWYGFGEGSGSGTAGEPLENGQIPSGQGGGGGGGGSARPLGYIRITGDDVRFEPIMDSGRVAMIAMAMAAWNVFWIATAVRAFARRR